MHVMEISEEKFKVSFLITAIFTAQVVFVQGKSFFEMHTFFGSVEMHMFFGSVEMHMFFGSVEMHMFFGSVEMHMFFGSVEL